MAAIARAARTNAGRAGIVHGAKGSIVTLRAVLDRRQNVAIAGFSLWVAGRGVALIALAGAIHGLRGLARPALT
jgi:hypothetical protein